MDTDQTPLLCPPQPDPADAGPALNLSALLPGPLHGEQTIFCDWLTISQEHHGQELPAMNLGFFAELNSEGEVIPDTIRGKRFTLPASHSSRPMLLVRGSTVTFSGNPAKLARNDNLFGHSIAQSVAAINDWLATLGLPPFTAGQYWHAPEGSCLRSGYTGARVSRIDITCNFATGSEADAQQLLHSLNGAACGTLRGGLLGDSTVEFTPRKGNASRRLYVKAYAKGPEILAHLNIKKRKKDLGPDWLDDPVAQHLLAVGQWCKLSGVIRFECEYKQTQLDTFGLVTLGALLQNRAMRTLTSDFNTRADVLKKPVQAGMSFVGAVPFSTVGAATAWMAGLDVRSLVPRASFYLHRKRLLPFGIDIAAVAPPPEKREVRVIKLQPLAIPSWYSLEREPYPWAHLPPHVARAFLMARANSDDDSYPTKAEADEFALTYHGEAEAV